MHGRHGKGTEGLLARLDKMVEAGRFTAAEAERLRSAAKTGDLNKVIVEIRSRHVTETLDAAVENGALASEEADAYLEQLARGQHPRLPVELRRRFGPGAREGSA